MENQLRLTFGLGDAYFDFDKREIIFERSNEGPCSVLGLSSYSMKVDFDDITEIELRKPQFLSHPGFALILNGKRMTNPQGNDVTQFLFSKKDYQEGVSALNRLARACHIDQLKEFGRESVPNELANISENSVCKPMTQTIPKEISKEFRMRCNVCGNIYCYTAEDLKENKSNARLAAMQSVGAIASVFAGTNLDMYEQNKAAGRTLSKVVDYGRCPKCNSTNVELMDDNEIKAPVATQSTTVSAADELKKFKELLDMGVITQEEFDAKKKQLLGL